MQRNRPLISDEEQRRLQAATILVAGCGSIGGSVIEPLVRLGAEHLVLAEPDGYEMHNMNRQSARLSDLGRNKAEVFCERMREVNPYAELQVERDGITSENVRALASTAAVVIDAVDVTGKEPLAAKVALHVEAQRARVPVVSGYDIGGLQLVHTYDYRDGRVPLLKGKVRADEIEGLEPFEFLAKVCPVRAVPPDFIPVFEEHVRGERGSFPQLVYVAQQFGVLATRAVVDLLAGRRVRPMVIIDVHDVLRPLGARAASRRDWVRGLWRLRRYT